MNPYLWLKKKMLKPKLSKLICDNLKISFDNLKKEYPYNEEKIEKLNKLMSMGFNSVEVKHLTNAKTIKIFEKNLLQNIIYFRNKYPQYLYITKEKIDELIEKENLKVIESYRYNGEISERCIEDILNFKINDEDISMLSDSGIKGMNFLSDNVNLKVIKADTNYTENNGTYYANNMYGVSYSIPKMMILMSNNEYYDDSVILYPIRRNQIDSYLVVSFFDKTFEIKKVNDIQNNIPKSEKAMIIEIKMKRGKDVSFESLDSETIDELSGEIC